MRTTIVTLLLGYSIVYAKLVVGSIDSVVEVEKATSSSNVLVAHDDSVDETTVDKLALSAASIVDDERDDDEEDYDEDEDTEDTEDEELEDEEELEDHVTGGDIGLNWASSVQDDSSSLYDDDDDDDDDEDDEDDDKEALYEPVPWKDMPASQKKRLLIDGITETMWTRWLEEEQQPYLQYAEWEDLPLDYQHALILLGWTQSSFNFKVLVPSISKLPWNELTVSQQEAATVLGYTSSDWVMMSVMMAEDFVYVALALDIPELRRFGWEYFETLEDVMVEVQDGATVGDDMGEGNLVSLASFIKLARKGLTSMYMKYEDSNGFKKDLPSELGVSVLTYMKEVLMNSKELREKGHWKKEYDSRSYTEYNWSVWIGGINTTTSIHYDTDAFNFLYVIEGKKRIVLIPNDERTFGNYTCIPAPGDSCWPGVDVLNPDNLPEHAVEIILGPGEGLSTPSNVWHAVENLEPTVAVAFRVGDGGIVDRPWPELSEEEQEMVKLWGIQEYDWEIRTRIGRDFVALWNSDDHDYSWTGKKESNDDDDSDDDDDDDSDDDEEEDSDDDDEEDSDDEEEEDSDDDVEFKDIDWVLLPEGFRHELQLLGYTKTLWDQDEPCYLEAPFWSDLSASHQQALEALECASTIGESYDGSCVNAMWILLSKEKQAAAKSLGYTQEEWDAIVDIRTRRSLVKQFLL